MTANEKRAELDKEVRSILGQCIFGIAPMVDKLSGDNFDNAIRFAMGLPGPLKARIARCVTEEERNILEGYLLAEALH